jgi:sterol desaturase/sphingolipid hydroxylase (fatty acid hydroxylase superfamily)
LPFAVVILLASFLALERFFPLRQMKSDLFARLVINLGISGLAYLTAMMVVRPSALYTLDWTAENSFGLLALAPVADWAKLIIGFLLLDLSFYYWHVLNHKVPVLWRFHNVHHIDPDLDVTTALRFHFGEVLLSTFFRIAQVSLIGVPFIVLAVYEGAFQANTLFHHSNVRLPIRLERLLNQFLVTPRMHGIHHSQVQDETNSNFGVVFPWWDKLHRSIGLNVPQAAIEVGIAGYSAPEHNRFWRALLLPFCKQRDYWRKPDGTMPQRHAAGLQGTRHYLAE